MAEIQRRIIKIPLMRADKEGICPLFFIEKKYLYAIMNVCTALNDYLMILKLQ